MENSEKNKTFQLIRQPQLEKHIELLMGKTA